MKSTHRHADNLITRLFSYTPRDGRDPLEDYCSEALAWCLRNSAALRAELFRLMKVKSVPDATAIVDVNTQHGYDDSEEESPKGNRGRFDITIESPDGAFFIAIESKVFSGCGTGQLERYLKRLRGIAPDFRLARLITLTNVRESERPNVTHLFWGTVCNALQVAADIESETNQVPSLILKQFKAFLEERGLGYFNMKEVTSTDLAGLEQAMDLRKEIETLLKTLKTAKHLKGLMARKQLVYDESENGLFLGLYLSWNPFLYVGFEVQRVGREHRLLMYVERAVKGDKRKRRLPSGLKSASPPTFKKQQTWYIFKQPVTAKYNGKAEEIRNWFSQTTEAALKLS
jgi:hypothetical protein